jgi:S1-C subfamily serine protease
MTASHVVEECGTLGIMTSAEGGLRAALVAAHPVADVSIFRTESSGPALALALTADGLRIGQGAFHFGFPEGNPGDAASRLIGRVKSRRPGRRGLAPLLAWAESSRVPEIPSLGGMSGGPTVDGEGRVIGVTVAESVRRGRILSAAPTSVAGTVRLSGASPAGTPAAGLGRGTLNASGYPEHGDALREQLTVALVVCLI